MGKLSLAFAGVVVFACGACAARLVGPDASAATPIGSPGARLDPARPETWPAALDAVAAAPQTHKVLLENEYVRVLEVINPPGVAEPLHTHPWPGVLYAEEPATYRIHAGSGAIVFDSARVPPASRSRPQVAWLAPQPPHSVETYGKETSRAIRVELKKCK